MRSAIAVVCVIGVFSAGLVVTQAFVERLETWSIIRLVVFGDPQRPGSDFSRPSML